MTTTTAGWALPWDGTDAGAARADLALVVAWSLEEAERMGETARMGLAL